MHPVHIKINKAYKSIPEGLEFEIPNLTILTGENGSGKTHLFEAIKNSRDNQISVNGKVLTAISHVGYGALVPKVGGKSNPAQVIKRLEPIWNELQRAQRNIISQAAQTPSIVNVKSLENDTCLSLIKNKTLLPLLRNVSLTSGVPPINITKKILENHANIQDLPENNPFSTQISQIFKQYNLNDFDNEMNKVYKARNIEEADEPLDEQEFIERYGEAPWDLLNSIMQRMKLPYRCNNPMGTKREIPFEFKLLHKDSNIEVDTNSLSSGEKTLMSLALAIYNFEGNGSTAEILIIDEPDAPLHPSMSSLMLKILEEDIVAKKGIPVIISTHSLTTIACSPANSLYKISSENKIPEKCSFEDSKEILALGIPNLSISVESRRQVFVEHQYDVIYYESLFNILSKKQNFKTNPQFLPPHTLNGSNCDAVLEITRKLRDMGNDKVYGLLDWDLHREPETQVIILGMGRRYAIENYVFEPHFLGLYLIYKNFIRPEEIGFSKEDSYLDVVYKISENSQELQKLATSVGLKIKWIGETNKTFESKLLDGTVIQIRTEFKNMRGHDLESLLRTTWPKLNSVRSSHSGDSALKKDIIDTVIHQLPHLISQDLVDTMKEFK